MLDCGLQAERTELAWRRTLLALIVVIIIACRAGDLLQAGAGAIAALVLLSRQGRRYRQGLAMLQAERAEPAFRSVVWMGVGVCVMAMLGMLRLVSGA